MASRMAAATLGGVWAKSGADKTTAAQAAATRKHLYAHALAHITHAPAHNACTFIREREFCANSLNELLLWPWWAKNMAEIWQEILDFLHHSSLPVHKIYNSTFSSFLCLFVLPLTTVNSRNVCNIDN